MPTVADDGTKPTQRRGRYPKELRRVVEALVIDQLRTMADVAEE